MTNPQKLQAMADDALEEIFQDVTDEEIGQMCAFILGTPPDRAWAEIPDQFKRMFMYMIASELTDIVSRRRNKHSAKVN